MKTRIIYEDREVLVVQKPAGLATQTARVDRQDVVSELKSYLAAQAGRPSGAPYLGIVHRLDQPVEGLLVLAKNKKAAAALTAQLSGSGQGRDNAGMLNKRYYGVFCGNASEKTGRLVNYLYKTADNRAEVLTEEEAQSNAQARRAVLEYRVLQETVVQGITLSLAEIQIETGRFHQIRAQMAHEGMSLLGDRKYGGEKSRRAAEQLGVQYVALCASSLEFVHPGTKKQVSFQVSPQGKVFSFFTINYLK